MSELAIRAGKLSLDVLPDDIDRLVKLESFETVRDGRGERRQTPIVVPVNDFVAVARAVIALVDRGL